MIKISDKHKELTYRELIALPFYIGENLFLLFFEC
jgi:hypothetical protein